MCDCTCRFVPDLVGNPQGRFSLNKAKCKLQLAGDAFMKIKVLFEGILMSLVMRKPAFCICENKDADQLRSDREADQPFVFATQIVQYLFFLNPKFQASSHLLGLYSPVCVGPGQKPRRPVFSQQGSNVVYNFYHASLKITKS